MTQAPCRTTGLLILQPGSLATSPAYSAAVRRSRPGGMYCRLDLDNHPSSFSHPDVQGKTWGNLSHRSILAHCGTAQVVRLRRIVFLGQKGGFGFNWHFNMGLFGKFIFSRKGVYDTRLALLSSSPSGAPCEPPLWSPLPKGGTVWRTVGFICPLACARGSEYGCGSVRMARCFAWPWHPGAGDAAAVQI